MLNKLIFQTQCMGLKIPQPSLRRVFRINLCVPNTGCPTGEIVPTRSVCGSVIPHTYIHMPHNVYTDMLQYKLRVYEMPEATIIAFDLRVRCSSQ